MMIDMSSTAPARVGNPWLILVAVTGALAMATDRTSVVDRPAAPLG
jgi:hypothetical protein